MNKPTPCSYLDSLNVNKMRFGLKAVQALLSRLDNPQKSYPAIIIAGTNGKGSTAAMTASILSSAGYNVGLYTSPHLVDVRERIMVNGKKISRKDFNRTIEQVKEEVTQPVTYFEFLTAAAFVYFRNRKIDIAVLEVGLGGRLDATNVCTPLVSVVTNIHYDHTAYLGNTLESITREKTGIVKPGGICLTAAKQKIVLKVMEEVCLKRRAKLYRFGRDIKIKKQQNGLLTYQGFSRNLKNIEMPLRGEHQTFNSALALATVELCARRGFSVDEEAMLAGLKKTHWEARMEILQERPLFLLDGAHNPAGIDSLCRALKKDFSGRRLILIFAALADKDYHMMLKRIIPLAHTVILTSLKTVRVAPMKDMIKTAKKRGSVPVIAETVPQAMEIALAMAGDQDLVCATGSFYLAGEIKETFPKLFFYGNKKPLRQHYCS